MLRLGHRPERPASAAAGSTLLRVVEEVWVGVVETRSEVDRLASSPDRGGDLVSGNASRTSPGAGDDSGAGILRTSPDSFALVCVTAGARPYEMPSPSPETDPLEQDAPRLVAALREASSIAAEAIDAVLEPGSTARAAGERLGVDKKLAWKLLRFARAAGPTAILQARPGRRGWEILLPALAQAGFAEARLAALRSSIAELHAALDDPMLGIDLASYEASRPRRSAGVASDAERRIRSAHLATRPGSVLTGRAKVLTYLVGRNRSDPDQVDLTVFELFDQIERQIPGEMLPVANCEMPEEELRRRLPAGMDLKSVPGRGGPLPPLVESASSPGLVGHELHAMDLHGMPTVGFTQRDPNRSGPLRMAFADHLPACGAIFSDGDRDGAEIVLGLPVQGWIEHAVLEVLWLRDVPSGGPPRASSHFPASGIPVHDLKSCPRVEVIERLDRCDDLALPSSLRTARAAHRRMIEEGLEFLGESYENFEHWRYVVECPSLRSQLMMRWPMAPRSPE